MKKFGKLLAVLASLTLTVCLAVLSFGPIGLTFAAEDKTVSAPSTTKNGVVSVNTVEVGKTVAESSLSGFDAIRDPFGVVTDWSNDYKFERAGYYTLILKNGGKNIDVFRIEAVTDGGELVIGNTAAIPTYVAPDDPIPLQEVTAKVMAGDEDLTDQYTIALKYLKPTEESVWTTVSNGEITFEDAGTYTVRYTATHKTITSLVLTQDFTVTAQEDFEDTVKPTLTVSGVPSTANLGVKLTLPKASATDNSDSNVAITVDVKAPNGEAIHVVKDEDAYPVEWDEEKTVEFDNDGNLSFWPQYEASGSAKYVVTYTATDDAGNTATASYGINVTDSRSPDIEIVDEELLPSTWGLSVTNADGPVTHGAFIPAAILKDNAPLGENADVTVTLRDPDGDIFFDSSSTDKGVGKVGSVTYANGEDAKGGYYFKPSDYHPEGKSNLGTYTITYRGHDAKNQYRTVTRTFVVDATAEDETKPSVTLDKSNPKILYAGDAFPTLTQTIDESNGYKLTKVITNGAKTFTDGKNGEEKIEDAKLVAGRLTYKVTVTDVFGNKTESETLTIDVIEKTSGKDVTIEHSDGATEGTTGTAVNVGSFTLKTAEKSDYIGFETFIVNPNGSLAATETTYKPVEDDTAGSKLAIEKIEFTPNLAGQYTFVLRAFDQGGKSLIKMIDITVTGSSVDGPGIRPGATTVNASVDAYSPYTLPSYTTDEGTEEVVKISGTRYSVMNKTFIPMSAGETYVYETYGRKGGVLTTPFRTNISCTSTSGITFKLMSEYESYHAKFDATGFDTEWDAAAGDTAKQKAAIVKYMIKVPQVDVLSKYGDVELEVKVSAPSSHSTANVKVIDTYKDDAENGGYYFRNDFDGTYTITYTATSGTATQTYTLSIKSGDITLPTIVVENAPSKNVVQNSSFSFSAVTVSDNLTTDSTKIKVNKSLIFNNSVVQSETTVGASSKKYTLDRVGVYTVRYEATDEAGNVAVKEYTITVSAEGTNEVNTQVISTVLIIVAALLIVGLLIYFFAFRKHDLDKSKK